MELPLNQIIQGDCLEILREFPSKSVHCVVTDPPYFLPAVHYNTRTQFSRNFADLGILESFFRNVFKELARIIKPNGCMYIFCDGQSYPLFYYHLYPYCKSVRPLVWIIRILSYLLISKKIYLRLTHE
jgi:site-specific DNA-methyltransferase (adenine-specific)